MLQKIKKNPEKALFLLSFIYLLFLGILLSYNYKIGDNCNLIFDADTKRVVLDATEIYANHYRINVHPLFVLLIQPICLILKGIVLNRDLAILIMSSFVSSLTVLFIYKFLNKIKKDNKANILVSLLYLFSFSNIIFTSSIETYNFAALFLLLLWYYYISKTDKFTIYSYIILVILGILSFSFTLTNIIVFFIVLFLLFIAKKVDLKKSIIITIAIIVSVFGLNIAQKLIWNNTPFFWKTSMGEEATAYGDSRITLNSIKNVIKNDYSDSIISSNIHMDIKYGTVFNNQNYSIAFNSTSILNIIVLLVFYVSSIVLLIRNFKKNKLLNIGLLLALTFNSLLHIIYGNDGAFLYSLHFLYLIVLLFGVNYLSEDNKNLKKYLNIFIIIFLLIEIITNNYIFIKVLAFVRDNIAKNYLMANLGPTVTILLEIFAIVLISSIIYLLINIIKKVKKEKNKEKKLLLNISVASLLIAIECVFVMIYAIEPNNKFLIFKLNNISGEVVSKEKKEYTKQEFKDYFKDELEALEEYQNELNEFKSTHSVELTSDANWTEYYYFGMANRRKILYQKNRLVDVETKEIIKEFTEKEHYIIPNIYTVIIETTNSKYIKIYEDENGITYQVNDKKEMLDNTKVNLYDFANQKYQNIKKELYGELLFNIKDEVIYPNIIVYDKPWYRDAAITSMVLKQTNNTDLIDEWVNNITEIYDLQNAGIQEPDNLGELLYLLSTQEELNNNLIDRIEEEAENIASSNSNGYYLYGKTDFGDQYLYQNLWYKLGIEAVGRKFNFDLSSIPKDYYYKMAWWSDYEVEDRTFEVSIEYPYLSVAAYHKLKEGTIPFNCDIYPLSWEIRASQANYENYKDLDMVTYSSSVSPLHSWSGAELLLLLLDETNDLDFK